MELRLLGRSPCWKTATVEHLAATIWSKKSQVADYDTHVAMLEPFIALQGKIVTLAILDVGDINPSKEVRERIKRLGEQLEPHVACSAVVLRCGGLEEVVIYGLLNLMNLTSKAAHVPHVTRSLEGAVDWLCQHDDRLAQLGAGSLQAAVARFAPPPGRP